MESEHDPARPRFLDLGVLAIEADGSEQRIGGRQPAFAAVSHAAMGVGVGLAARRPGDAVAWADRMLDHHRQLGLGDTPMLMELKADALCMAGQGYEATVWHSAAEAHSKRAGMRYPVPAVSADLAALAAASLTDAERDRARSEGARRSQEEISGTG